MAQRILLTDDDPALSQTLTDALVTEGFEVTTAADGVQAIELGSRDSFDLILLDVGLPRCDGYEVCGELRRRGVAAAILMLTGRAAVADRVRGLNSGADDYLIKPFAPAELFARLSALLRRRGADQFVFGSVRADLRHGLVFRNGERHSLSAKEAQLLRYFLARPGLIIPREQLLLDLWGHAGLVTRTLDMHVAHLRQKIEVNPHTPRYLRTVRGIGYVFDSN
jgi:DNA-binding response OmpR family regulator